MSDRHKSHRHDHSGHSTKARDPACATCFASSRCRRTASSELTGTLQAGMGVTRCTQMQRFKDQEPQPLPRKIAEKDAGPANSQIANIKIPTSLQRHPRAKKPHPELMQQLLLRLKRHETILSKPPPGASPSSADTATTAAGSRARRRSTYTTPQTWRHLRLQCHPDDIQAQSAKICCQKESSPEDRKQDSPPVLQSSSSHLLSGNH